MRSNLQSGASVWPSACTQALCTRCLEVQTHSSRVQCRMHTICQVCKQVSYVNACQVARTLWQQHGTCWYAECART